MPVVAQGLHRRAGQRLVLPEQPVEGLLLALLPEFVVFVAWVLYAIAQGHWHYSGELTLGVRLPGGIPVEEVLFFLVVPLCAVLAFEAVRKVTGWDPGYPEDGE